MEVFCRATRMPSGMPLLQENIQLAPSIPGKKGDWHRWPQTQVPQMQERPPALPHLPLLCAHTHWQWPLYVSGRSCSNHPKIEVHTRN